VKFYTFVSSLQSRNGKNAKEYFIICNYDKVITCYYIQRLCILGRYGAIEIVLIYYYYLLCFLCNDIAISRVHV